MCTVVHTKSLEHMLIGCYTNLCYLRNFWPSIAQFSPNIAQVSGVSIRLLTVGDQDDIHIGAENLLGGSWDLHPQKKCL